MTTPTIPASAPASVASIEALVDEVVRAARLDAHVMATDVEQRKFRNARIALRAEVSRLAAEGVGATWLPIESAPLDKTRVFLGCFKRGYSAVGVGHYMPMDGWSKAWRSITGDYQSPTHWMPIPAAPGAAQGEAKPNALRANHPLAEGQCVHGARLSQHCYICDEG